MNSIHRNGNLRLVSNALDMNREPDHLRSLSDKDRHDLPRKEEGWRMRVIASSG
jgi:hypothetical protein